MDYGLTGAAAVVGLFETSNFFFARAALARTCFAFVASCLAILASAPGDTAVTGATFVASVALATVGAVVAGLAGAWAKAAKVESTSAEVTSDFLNM
jgi:hypothetical protein